MTPAYDSIAIRIGNAELIGVRTSSAEEYHHRWRITACDSSGALYVFLFEDQASYESVTLDELYARLVPAFGEDLSLAGHHPSFWSPAPPRRLPLFGETPQAFATREILDEWFFGSWLCSHKHGDARELVDSLDNLQCLSVTSINDALFSARRTERTVEEDIEDGLRWDDCGRSVESGAFQDEFGMDRDELYELLMRYAEKYLRIRLAARGFRFAKVRLFAEHKSCEWAEVPRVDVGGVYFVVSGERDERVKIGHAKNIRKRVAELQTAAPYKLKLAAIMPSGDPPKAEAEQHQKFKALRVQGEWFRLEGGLLDHVRKLRQGKAA